MPTEKVIFGAVAYTDADGMQRIAQQGEEVDFTAAEAKRLKEMGALFDQKAEDARVKAEEAARQETLAAEQAARDTAAERLAGEEAARVKAQKGAAQNG